MNNNLFEDVSIEEIIKNNFREALKQAISNSNNQ